MQLAEYGLDVARRIVQIVLELDDVELLEANEMIERQILAVEQQDAVVPVGPEHRAELVLALYLRELLDAQVGHAEQRQVGHNAKLMWCRVPFSSLKINNQS